MCRSSFLYVFAAFLLTEWKLDSKFANPYCGLTERMDTSVKQILKYQSRIIYLRVENNGSSFFEQLINLFISEVINSEMLDLCVCLNLKWPV